MISETPSEDPASQPPKRHDKTVYIFNMSEDVWPFIQAMTDPVARSQEIDENADLADRELFSIADESDAIFISPKPLDPAFVDYYQELFGVKQVTVLSPKNHSGMTCEDILADSSLMEELERAANSVRKLTLISYTASPQFFNLVHVLKDRGITVSTPESPEEESAWAVNFFGSKSGIRQLSQQSAAKEPDLRMSEGLIVSGIADAAKIAANKYIKEKGVVIKTNKGHSGAGVLILRENDLPYDYNACDAAILSILKRDAYWEQFPIVVESLIHINPAIAGGFPNVEFKIAKNGKIDFLYHCGLRVLPNGVFKGIEINENIITDRVAARIIDTGFYIAEQYVASGYRGFFDVDFVAAKNGEIYVTESNARRTGGTHVWSATLRLIGKDFMTDRFVFSDNAFSFAEHRRVSFTELLTTLSPILFDKKTKEGVVVTSSNLLKYHRIGYIIFGVNEKRALEIEREMERLLGTLSSPLP
jgi:hypothetical protein